MWSTPAALALANWCVRKGTPAAGTMGFGVCTVSGRSRVPLPPTRRIASVTCRLCFLPGPAELSFDRPVYADRSMAPSRPCGWPPTCGEARQRWSPSRARRMRPRPVLRVVSGMASAGHSFRPGHAPRFPPSSCRRATGLGSGLPPCGPCRVFRKGAPRALGREPVPMAGDHMQQHLLAFCVEIATT